ncbi:MAG: DUF5916 domain-containing protein [Gammaproteobacteria bacterium]|nr:DUF5916 domain-containing protein [Gammaproteobacteria bacterium]
MSRTEATALALSSTPELDGMVRGDPVWDAEVPLTDFTQLRPENGKAASHPTQVYFGFTQSALHIAFLCYEDDPSQIVVSSNGDRSDSVAIILDTFMNGRTGFVFATSPNGPLWDGALSSGNTDWNWSTTWRVKSLRTPFGWSTEMEIPFSSLRYGSEKVQSWGVNIARVTIADNEISYWSPIPAQFSMYRIDLAGRIHGIEVPSVNRNLQFTPYVRTGNVRSDFSVENQGNDGGFDVKYSITSGMTLDVTYNTDFAQVESDQLQVNLGRYGLYFPETRPFFLENQALFTVGVPWQTQLFHSRRIGIAPNGQRLPIDGGIRITGKVASQTNLGFLQMRSHSYGSDDKTDFTVFRMSRDLKNRSSIGFLGSRRQDKRSSGDTLGINGSFGIGERTDIHTFAATTRTDGFVSDEHAYNIYINHNSPTWKYQAWIHEVGRGFNPEVGFVSRTNMRSTGGVLRYTHAIDNYFGLKELNQYYSVNATRNLDGYLENGGLHLEIWPVWDNGADGWVAVDLQYEEVRSSFPVAGVLIPPGKYNTKQFSIAGNLPNTQRIRGGMFLSNGGFYNGNLLNTNAFFSYQRDESLSFNVGYQHRKIGFPSLEKDVTVANGSVGVAYSFTPQSALFGQLQRNRIDDIWSLNLRYRWQRNANSGLYVVYSYFGLGTEDDTLEHQEFVVKYSHTFNVLQ